MRKQEILSFFVVLLLFFFVVGCQQTGKPVSLAETSLERNARIRRAISTNHRELIDDIDIVLLIDQPSSLNRLHVR